MFDSTARFTAFEIAFFKKQNNELKAVLRQGTLGRVLDYLDY